ncbi:unnamed protein product, partial [Soboliphyme baturini]|uniref:PH domain-containing protein n=1 Tax=Soboliphyme baturini TaxID=241478 RepID=A0A183J5N9_9BILA
HECAVKGDAVRQFCEKHYQKIKNYIADLNTKYPVPCQCTVEESGNKQIVRIHFACQDRSDLCLYTSTCFAFKTKIPHLWLHLMFLHLQLVQKRSGWPFIEAVTDSSHVLFESISVLKTLQLLEGGSVTPNSGSFLRSGEEAQGLLGMSDIEFNQVKKFHGSDWQNHKDAIRPEQQVLLTELQVAGYYDLFAYNAAKKKWCCFACNHPERVQNFLKQSNAPVIEGQLKEKKGRWKFFKRWRTRYFTLS